MVLNRKSIPALLGVGSFLCLASASHAVTNVFSDDFETGNLNKWDHTTYGQVVKAPVDVATHDDVLNFTNTNRGGDLFSKTLAVTAGQTYSYSFDYLGTSNDADGFAGFNAPAEDWVAGVYGYPSDLTMVNDGTWHHYTHTFVANGSGSIVLKLEEFDGSNTHVAGNAYFDNVGLTAIPEASTMLGFGSMLGVGGFGLLRSRRVRKTN